MTITPQLVERIVPQLRPSTVKLWIMLASQADERGRVHVNAIAVHRTAGIGWCSFDASMKELRQLGLIRLLKKHSFRHGGSLYQLDLNGV